MRIRVIHRPSALSVDGLELGHFEPGRVYDVGTALGSLMLSEGWAEPVGASESGPDEVPTARADDRFESEQRERSTPADLHVAADDRRRR